MGSSGINTVIHEDEEYTFRYRFRPIDTLDPVEYHIALTVFYENDEELFSHTFFNDTVTFYEPTSMFDSGNIMKLLLGAAVACSVFFTGCDLQWSLPEAHWQQDGTG